MDLTSSLRALYAPGVAYEIATPDQPIPDMVLDVAARYPKRAAIDFFARQLSYEQLVEQMRRCAGALHQAGVRAGDRVALIMPNCPQHAVAVLGTMLLGAVVVEHNPLAPSGELEGEYARHGARVTIAWSKTLEKLTFLGRGHTTFSMDLTTALPTASRLALKLPLKAARDKRDQLGSPRPTWARSWTRAMRTATPWNGTCPASMDDVALLIHTGGTTGVPKAAALTHANLRANVEESIAWVPVLHEGRRGLLLHPAPLPRLRVHDRFPGGPAHGGDRRHVPEVRHRTGPGRPAPTPLHVLPGRAPHVRAPAGGSRGHGRRPVLHPFLPVGRDAPVGASGPKMGGGDRRPHDRRLRHDRGIPNPPRFPPGLLAARGALGIPFPSTRVRIVDPEDPARDVEDGAVGELIATGPQVFSGYWNQDEETAEVFTADGWLRTGDLVQVRDGFIYMADRRKEMINSSGFNVYPSQVEDAVAHDARHPRRGCRGGPRRRERRGCRRSRRARGRRVGSRSRTCATGRKSPWLTTRCPVRSSS